MGKMDKEVFVCLDCETTGLDPVQDRVIEVAVIKFTLGEILEEFEVLVNPNCPIPETSIAIHHITQEMVEGKPVIEEMLPKIIDLLGSHIVVGHGVGFDIQLLINAAQRSNIPCGLSQNRILDTLRMARQYGESPVNSLEQLRRHFNIPAVGAHRAMGDVMVNVEVFKCLARDYNTTEDLFEMLSRPILFKTMPLGKHKGRQMSEVPLEYLLWAGRKDFDQDLLYSIRTEIKKRKKGNLFSQATNPFHNLMC